MLTAHLGFDLAAWLAALLAAVVVYQLRLRDAVQRLSARLGPGYFASLLLGGAAGSVAFGTFNLLLSGQTGVGRSLLGGLVGAIGAVEIYKRQRGIRGSTGMVLALPFAVAVVIGRWGCFSAGLDDFTYGEPSALPWAVDLGDGIARHPVQLYESLAMAMWLAFLLGALARRRRRIVARGFYLTMGFYGIQRFAWEFFKPYASVLGPLNLYHLLSLLLVAYAATMLQGDPDAAT